MTDLQKVKISISILISLGVAKSQKEIGLKMGYESESAFSQIVNGKVAVNHKFVKKLREMSKEVDNFWEYGFGGKWTSSEPLGEEIKRLIREKEELFKKVIYLQDRLLDKSISPGENIVDDKL